MRHRFKVFTGTIYLGGLIGDGKSKREWLKDRTSKWETKICEITETAERYPQKSYAVVVCAIQTEWIFLQHVTKDTGYAFE